MIRHSLGLGRQVNALNDLRLLGGSGLPSDDEIPYRKHINCAGPFPCTSGRLVYTCLQYPTIRFA